MAAQQGSPGAEADALFTEARDRFLECLAKSDREQYATCASPNELISQVQKFANFKDNCPRFTHAIKCITTFCNRLEPYFETVGIFVQSHPEFAAIAWGAVRLILKLASNFGGFFQKLTSMLSEIAGKLPFYQEILRVSPTSVSDSFRKSLVKLYSEVFDFFTAVARIFTQKPGTPKRTPAIILDLMWRPFDYRLEEFKGALHAHSNILRAEQSLIQLRMTADIMSAQADQQQTASEARDLNKKMLNLLQKLNENGYHLKQEFKEARHASDTDRILRWLDPVAPDLVHGYFWKASEARQDCTAEWILTDPLFASWNSNDSCVGDNKEYGRCLWIEGNPGVGKTVLAASVLESLQKSCTTSTGNSTGIVTYFFFSYANQESTLRLNAYREILSQIFHGYKHDAAIFDAFVLARMSSSSSKASTNELLELLRMLVSRHMENLKILLDGVDEADDPDRVVKDITTAVKGTRAKTLLFSQPNVKTLRGCNGTPHLTSLSLTRRSVEGDIRQYLSDKLCSLVDRGLLVQPPTDYLINHLLDCANGMFLWARLMMDYVESPALGSPEYRMRALWGATEHEDLGQMYLRILALISKQIKPERILAQKILTWLTFQHRFLSRSELWEVLYKVREPHVPPGTGTTELLSPRDASTFDNAVIILCGSLVERIRDGFRLIHYTAAEFLQDPEAWNSKSTPSQQLTNPAQSHAELAEQCLTYLVVRIPSTPLSGDKRCGVPTDACRAMIPFASYAALCWVTHARLALLRQCPLPEATIKHFSNFISDKAGINAWVELLYTFASRETILTLITELQDLAALLQSNGSSICRLHDLGSRTTALSQDMASLDDNWGETLIKQPFYIWNDVTAFGNSTSFATTPSVFLHSFAPRGNTHTSLSSKPLFTISRTRTSDETLGVLSIWPPKSFDDAWRQWFDSCGSGRAIDTLYWEARLETWSIGINRKLSDTRFHIHPQDIANHYEGSGQLLQSGFMSEMSKSFPAAISGRLDFVVILNSLYFINRQVGGTFQVQRTPLPPFEPETVWRSTFQIMRYSYSYEISENGLYLGMGSSKSWMSRSSPHTTSSIFVFRVIQSRNACEFMTSSRVERTDFKFHPRLPIIVASSIPASNAEHLLTLWLFDADAHHSMTLSNDGQNSFSHPVWLEPIHPISRHFQGSFEFSACGRNIIIRSEGCLSTIVSVESSCLYQKTVCHQRRQNDLEAHDLIEDTTSNFFDDTDTASSAISALSSTAFLTKSASRFSLDPVVASAMGQYEVSLEHKGKSKSIELALTSSSHIAKSHLLSVPDAWTDLGDGVKPCIITQNRPEFSPSFSVLLTQDPKHSYDPLGPRDFHLPALLQKDITALLPSVYTTYNPSGSSRKRPAGAIDNGDGSELNKVRKLHRKKFPGTDMYIYEMDEHSGKESPPQS